MIEALNQYITSHSKLYELISKYWDDLQEYQEWAMSKEFLTKYPLLRIELDSNDTLVGIGYERGCCGDPDEYHEISIPMEFYDNPELWVAKQKEIKDEYIKQKNELNKQVEIKKLRDKEEKEKRLLAKLKAKYEY